MSKSFIPRDKPKSFVIFACACLTALLVASPIGGLGLYFDIQWLFNLSRVIFMICWVVAAIFGIYGGNGNISGRYKDIQAREWKDQVW